MWELGENWWEIVIRGIVIYGVIFALFRLIGKKQLGELAAIDLVLIFIVSEAVGPALVGKDTSLAGGLISAVTLLALNYAVDFLAFKSRKFEQILEGTPQIIIRDGKVFENVRQEAKITENELKESLRMEGIKDVSEIHLAVLETNGKISVIKKT